MSKVYLIFFSLKNIGFPNGPVFIPENHGPFGNFIPVRVNQAILCFNLTSFLKNSALIKNFVKYQQLKNDFYMGHVEIRFPHGQKICQIAAV